MGIAVLGDSPLKEPKDLEGKKLGATVTSGEYPFLPALAKKTGFDWSKVQVVALDPQVRQRALIGKQVDAISAFSTASIPAMVVEGIDARFLSFDSYGLNLYGLSLVTQPDRARADKALTQAVVDGALEGLAFTLTDPDESIAIFKSEVKEFAASPKALEREALGFNMMQLSILSEEAKKSGIGWQRPEAFAAMTDLIMTYLVPKDSKRPDVASLYTNEFVGKVRLDEAQWKAAEARYASAAFVRPRGPRRGPLGGERVRWFDDFP
jgi:NitT/TauT family transport system substrate-binding protein